MPMRFSDRRAIALVVVIVAVAWSDILVAGRGFYRNDVISYHYPMKSAVRQIVAHGGVPYWNPYVSSGQPLAANPAYEVWYPPQWLVFLPSFHYGLQLHIVLHFFLAAIGMFLLLRSLDLSIAASLFGALALAFSGPYLSLSSKLPLLFALSWMPLALYFVRETVLREWRWPRFIGAVVAVAMQLLIGEPTVVLQTWILIAAWIVWRLAFRRDVPRVAGIAVAAAFLAAIQLLPAIDFARDTARARGFPFVIVSNWSMPLVRPAEMLLPSMFAHMTADSGAPLIATMYPYRTDPYLAEIYVGVLVALLAVAGLFVAQKGRSAVLALFAAAFVAAAGEHLPLLRFLYDLHLGHSLRYPEKFILGGAFVVIVWAAMLFDRLRDDTRLARIVIALATLTAIVLAFVAIAGETRYWLLNIARLAVVIALAGPLRARLPRAWWQTAVIALTSIDLYASMQQAAARMPRSFFDPPALAASMPKQPEFRYFHDAGWELWEAKPGVAERMVGTAPEEYWRNIWAGLFPNLTELYGFHLALEDDIDQTSLKNTDDLREVLKAVRRAGEVASETTLLQQSNVRWRIRFASDTLVQLDELAPYPRFAFADTIIPASSAGDVRVNLSRAVGAGKIAFTDVAPFHPSSGVVSDVREDDAAIRLTTRNAGRGLLLIAVTAHKYWRATIDGRAAPLLTANVAYQALDVPAGAHAVELRYRNPLIAIGATLSLLTILALAVLPFIRRPASPPPPETARGTTSARRR
jgi:hypothetical protein